MRDAVADYPEDAVRGGAPAGRRSGTVVGAAPVLGRRRVLALALLVPAAAAGLSGCTARRQEAAPDPLIALADAARADAALAAAAVAANPELAGRVDPLRAARTEHAVALEAEVVRLGGTPVAAATAAGRPAASGAPAPPGADPTVAPTGVTQTVTLARVREAVAASQRGAAALVPDLPAERVGLVASISACCATYAAVLA